MTSIADQYRIINSRAGWIDRSSRGRLRFQGADAGTFLQGLLTNDVASVEPGRGVYAAYLTPIGRMVTDITVLNRGTGFLGLVAAGQAPTLAARFDQLIFSEDLTVADVSPSSAEIFVTGAAAADVSASVMEVSSEALSGLPELGQVDGAAGFVMRDGASPFPAFRLVVDVAERDRVVAALEAAGTVAMDDETATALRIESGRGEWGSDLGDEVIPLEAGLLDRAISTTKGCYVGQEIIIRILHRGGGRVAKRLVTLAFDPSVDAAPAAGAPIDAGTGAAGHLTSVAFSPARGCYVAFGYLPRDAAEPHRAVTVTGSGARAVVTGFGQ